MEVGGMVACPVCTLYLREGISMYTHLDTHPKEQVIDALIRLYSGGVELVGPVVQPLYQLYPPPYQTSYLPGGPPDVVDLSHDAPPSHEYVLPHYQPHPLAQSHPQVEDLEHCLERKEETDGAAELEVEDPDQPPDPPPSDPPLPQVEGAGDGGEREGADGAGGTGSVDGWESSLVEKKVRSYPCTLCEVVLRSVGERRLHLETEHPPPETIVPDEPKLCPTTRLCTACHASFTTVRQLRDHRRLHHPRPPLQCHVCGVQFPSRQDYSAHVSDVHPLECGRCGKTFKTPAGLRAHSKTHLLVKPHSCNLCPKTFVSPQKLREHINGHTGLAPYTCDLCPAKFNRYSNLKQHKDANHFNVKKKKKDYFCDCGESFTTKKKLAWHRETHTLKPKQCPHCSDKFIHANSLTRHVRRQHDAQFLPPPTGGGRRNVTCPVCQMVCLESSLPQHLRTHSAGKPYSCVICGKRFTTKWNLGVHKWSHKSRVSKPYKCNLCKGAFVRFGDFQSHVRSHLGHKPYTCNHCGLQFVRKQNWRRHEREHTGCKTYHCGDCDKTFFRSYYLTDHVRTHTGQKPYSCHICQKVSGSKSNHNKHLKTHHARETLNTEG